MEQTLFDLDNPPRTNTRRLVAELKENNQDFEFYRCLCCLHYQSSEDLKIKSFNHVFKALEMIKNFIAGKIAFEAGEKFDIWGE